jgi:hypothetical protein
MRRPAGVDGDRKARRDRQKTAVLDRRQHVAQNLKRSGGSAIDARTTRHAGYEISQFKRKCIEQLVS